MALIKYVPKASQDSVLLCDLTRGQAFKFDGETYIMSDEAAEDGVCIRCMLISGEDPGYLAHLVKNLEVEPVNLTISED